MRNFNSQPAKVVPYWILIESVIYITLILLLSSCSTELPIQRIKQQANDSTLATHYSIICIIHGDGDYLYHDTSGKEHEADTEALAKVINVAQQNPQAEVFIFHQKPRRHFLFFFPLRDGEFYYYRNGQLIANESYWRDQENSSSDPEVDLYRRFRLNNHFNTAHLLLYFGHEIPEFGGLGYDASYPDRPFTVNILANKLKDFTLDSTKFDLLILSTCYGGTPYTIGTLGLFSKTIIASPDNLHLSYFDLHPLERLDLSLGDGDDIPSFAKNFAQHAFDKLTVGLQTAVSIAVYDVKRIQRFIHSVNRIYDFTLNALKGKTESSLSSVEHCDCADIPEYSLPTINEGVDILYRPPAFGRLKHKQTHSGWECWDAIGSQPNSSQITEPVLK